MTGKKILAGGIAALGAVALLVACGGSVAAHVGGTVTGLLPGASVQLQNNFSDFLTVTADGTFQMPSPVPSGNAYSITVAQQPNLETCTIANGSGVIDPNADDVTSVGVTCQVINSISGMLSGLGSGDSVTLALSLGGGTAQTLPLAVSGPFSFPGNVAAGTAYSVTVATQPANQTCTVQNGSGTVPASGLVSVTVNCS